MTAFTSISTSIPFQTPAAKTTLSDRFILAQVKATILVVPASWVDEIFQVERSQILPLPFYSSSLIGLAYQGGRVLPLVCASSLLGTASSVLREKVMVIKLGNKAGALAQVGLVVEHILGSQTRAALPQSVFSTSTQSTSDIKMVLLRPEEVKQDLWQPQCWLPSMHS